MTQIKHETTQKASHTPGPWHRDGFNLSAIIRLVYPKGHPECRHIGGTYETIARCESENWDANSRLIAAAPTMASRIQGAIDCLSQNKVFPADIEQAKRLLANALTEAGIDVLPLDRAAHAEAEGEAV